MTNQPSAPKTDIRVPIAPDDTWLLRSESQPEPNVWVEGCWHVQITNSPEYQFAPLITRRHVGRARTSIVWCNRNGHEVMFMPDFWRPIPAVG